MPWGRKAGAVCRHGSAPGTPTGAARLWRNGSWVCRTCWSDRREYREETTGWKPTGQRESESCAPRQRVWRGSKARPYLVAYIIQEYEGKQEQKRNANLPSARTEPKTIVESDVLEGQKSWFRNRCRSASFGSFGVFSAFKPSSVDRGGSRAPP